MAQTQRKPVYIQPEHHEMLRKIAYEQNCTLSDVLDVVLEQAVWEKVSESAGHKPRLRAMERQARYET